jgi:hypothetical protein
MNELLDRLENFCKENNIDLDGVLNTLNEPQRIDTMDVVDKHETKMKILRNVLSEFFKKEGQEISDEHLEFAIRISNYF